MFGMEVKQLREFLMQTLSIEKIIWTPGETTTLHKISFPPFPTDSFT